MKFAIIICSALLVAGAPSREDDDKGHHDHHKEHVSLTEKAERLQVKIQNMIQDGLGAVIGVSMIGKEKAEQLQKSLEKDVEQYEADITKETNALLQETKSRIQAFAEHAGEVNVQECLELGSSLDALAEEAIANLTACANRRLERGEGYLRTLIELSDKITYNLTSLTQEARRCAENVDGIKSASKAIVCSEVVAAKAIWIAAQGIPSVTANIAKLTYLMSTLKVSLPHCSSNHGYAQFAQQCAQDLRKAQKCVEHTIEKSIHKSYYQ